MGKQAPKLTGRPAQYVRALDESFRLAGRPGPKWNSGFTALLASRGLVLVAPRAPQDVIWPKNAYPDDQPYEAPKPCGPRHAWRDGSLVVWSDSLLVMGEQLDPLDVRSLRRLLQNSRALRLVALLPAPGHEIARLWVYGVQGPDPVLEKETAQKGGEVVGYFNRDARPADLLSTIGHAFEVMADRREQRAASTPTR